MKNGMKFGRKTHEMVVGSGTGARKHEHLHHAEKGLAHYSKATYDIEYRFPCGMEELEGIANRTDYDLGNHTKAKMN